MGLFDIVIVEYPLPDSGAGTVKQWQTKDFDPPYMKQYKITTAGRLLRERIHYEDRSDQKAPKDSLESLRGCMTPIHEALEDLNYHGILNFYGSAHSGELVRISLQPATFGQDLNHADEVEWFEYNAKFTDGELVGIEQVRNG